MRRSGDITDAQYASAAPDRSLHLRPSPAYASREPYFVGYVENLLQQAYGAATVRAGGLKIYTTIRPRLQHAAVHALSEELHDRHDPAGTIVSIDPATGAIRAMAAVTPGTPGNEFNLATTAQRQAGSTFKPIVLAAAVAEGMNPWATRYLSAPFYYAPLQWRVRTYDGTYAGPETVAAATLHSDNTVYARLALDVGPEAITAMAQKLGVQTQLQPTPSLALGTGAVTPLDMASVYATLAAGGVYSRPLAIRRVVFPGGKVGGGWGQSERTRVVPDWVAATVTHVLEENMLHGTGVGAHVPGRADAGKTGTTDDYADAWFCGYTPSLEATVWMGYPKGEIPMLDVHGAAVSGPTLPATAWRLFMERAAEAVAERRVPGAAVSCAVRALDRAPRLPRHGVADAVVVAQIRRRRRRRGRSVVVVVVVVPSVVGVVVGIVGVVPLAWSPRSWCDRWWWSATVSCSSTELRRGGGAMRVRMGVLARSTSCRRGGAELRAAPRPRRALRPLPREGRSQRRSARLAVAHRCLVGFRRSRGPARSASPRCRRGRRPPWVPLPGPPAALLRRPAALPDPSAGPPPSAQRAPAARRAAAPRPPAPARAGAC